MVDILTAPPSSTSPGSLVAAVGGRTAPEPPLHSTRSPSINQSDTGGAALSVRSIRRAARCKPGFLSANAPPARCRFVLRALTGSGCCFFAGETDGCGGSTEGGVASGFRNSIHCSSAAREENASVERRANQRPQSCPGPRPQAYIKGSAVSSVGHWHNIRPRAEQRRVYVLPPFISAVLYFIELKQWQTHKWTPARISQPRT